MKELLHRRENRAICRELFLMAYSLPVPLVVLNRIVHWQVQMDLIKASTGFDSEAFGNRKAWLMGGYFYNFSTPCLSEEEIYSELEEGKRHDAKTFLVPTVRDSESTDSLRAAGFIPFPCFVEAVFELEHGVEEDFRKRVSRNRFAKIRQAARRAHEEYDLCFYRAKELSGNNAVLAEVSRLHEVSAQQHNLAVNIYNIDVLNEIMSSSLRDNLLVGLRYNRSTNAVVQAVVCFLCEETGELYASAHGINHDVVSRRQNLLTALYYDLFMYGEEHGFKVFYMGRGGHEEKRSFGASKFHQLNYWIKSDEKSFDNEIGKLADAARAICS